MFFYKCINNFIGKEFICEIVPLIQNSNGTRRGRKMGIGGKLGNNNLGLGVENWNKGKGSSLK